MAGLSSDGFSIKRLAEVISDRQSSARNYFGNDAAVGVNDVLGRALRIHSPAEADLWELAEAVYNSFNPAVATGNQLDVIVSYAGLTRLDATPSTATLLVVGDGGTVIPELSTVTSSVTGEEFETTEQVSLTGTSASGAVVEVVNAVEGTSYIVTLGENNYSYTAQSGDSRNDIATVLAGFISTSPLYTASVVNVAQINIIFSDVFVTQDVSTSTAMTLRKVRKLVSSQSTSSVPVEQEGGSLDTISSSVTGWDSVTNPEDAVVGRERETDGELRVRFANTKESRAKGTIDSIYSNLLSLAGIESVQVYENTTDVTDANGIPAHSISAVIYGGNSQVIADTLWEVKPAGINTSGNTSVVSIDTQGVPHVIRFNRPEETNVYFEISISQAEGETLPSNAASQVKSVVTEYIENLGVGADVIYSRLFIPIQTVEGVQVDSLTIGTSPNPTGSSNVVIAYDEIATTIEDNVVVTVI